MNTESEILVNTHNQRREAALSESCGWESLAKNLVLFFLSFIVNLIHSPTQEKNQIQLSSIGATSDFVTQHPILAINIWTIDSQANFTVINFGHP